MHTQKNALKPWQHHQSWCLPQVGEAFVAAMEDGLDLYEQLYEVALPVVCFDEKLVLLHADAHPTQPGAPGVLEQARQIVQRFEFHSTPKHGSRLNMAELEIGVFERGCLRHRAADVATLEQRIGALEAERNEERRSIH